MNRRKMLELLFVGGLANVIPRRGNSNETPTENEDYFDGPGDPTPIEPGKAPKPVPDLEFRVVGDELRKLTSHWILLTAQQDNILKYLHASEVEGDVAQLERTLREVWREYPIKAEQIGNVTYLVPEDTLRTEITPLTSRSYPRQNELGKPGKDRLGLTEVATAVAGGFNKHIKRTRDSVEFQWAQNTHQDMAYLSGDRMGVEEPYKTRLHDSADDPDKWDEGGVPGYIGEPWRTWYAKLPHMYTHYYNPTYDFGEAPQHAANYLNIAKSDYEQYQYWSAYQKLGWALHFITDMGQPLHTGAEASQIIDLGARHYDYEGYIAQNWSQGHYFSLFYDANGYYYPIIDPEQAAKDLAGYSNQYLGELWTTIVDNPNNWKNMTITHSISINVLAETALFAKGFIWYMRN